MKKLLKIIIILAIILTILVGLPLILLHKKTAAPIDQYTVESETAFYSALDQELEDLITDDEEDYITLTIDEAFINRALQKGLSKDNPKYLNPLYEDEPEYKYMAVFGKNLGLKGVWTTLSDDQIVITAGVDNFGSSGRVNYQSGLEIIFDIVLSENDQYYLKVAKIEVGKIRLPLKSAFKLADFIIKTVTQKSLNEMIAEELSFGTFDLEEMSFTVGEAELTDYLYDLDPTFAALLKVIYQENLLILDISDEGFDISLNIGVFRRLAGDLNEPAFTRWENEFDKAQFMANLAAQAASNFILNPLDPKIDLTEADVNSILDYTLGEKVQFEFPITFMLEGDEVEYMFNSTNLFVRMEGNILSIHLMMTLSKTDMSGTFDMQFNLTSTVSMNAEGDMVLTIIEANIGEVDLDNEILTILFGVFDETLMVDDTIVIPKETLNRMFEGSNIVIEDSYVLDGELVLHFDLDN